MHRQLGLLEQSPPDQWDRRDRLTIRESRRAKRLILQLIPPHTLELVVPMGTRPRSIEAFVQEHRAWIEQAQFELGRNALSQRGGRPDRIRLKAVDREWSIRYRGDGTAGRPGWSSAGDELTVTTADDRGADGPHVLRQWLLAQARVHLKPWLMAEAARCGLQPNKVHVRVQKTCWGSCSSRRNISLNAALLFLEPALVRYLFIHELCHLVVLDHSPRFWRQVERFEPGCRELDDRLGESWTEIPIWVFKRS